VVPGGFCGALIARGDPWAALTLRRNRNDRCRWSYRDLRARRHAGRGAALLPASGFAADRYHHVCLLVVAELVVAELVVAELVVAELVVAKLVVAKLVVAELVVAKFIIAKLVIAKLVVAKLVLTEFVQLADRRSCR
jgi:hypothetical protein